MSANIKNLDWLRKLTLPDVPDFGARMYEMVSGIAGHLSTLEQQTNSRLDGTPTPPPAVQALNVVPHPQGVEFAIQHDGEFYEGINYEIDFRPSQNPSNVHTYSVGPSRNGVLPVGPVEGTYQVRAKYPTGISTAPVVYGGSTPKTVAGASVTSPVLLSSQGAGTTRKGQPPGFGGPFRSSNGAPPIRSKT